MSGWLLAQADARRLPLADQSVDLVFGSPPYVDARLYLESGKNLGIARGCVDWVEWMLGVTVECLRVSRGAVLWVAAGVTRDRNYQPACEGLMWEWYRRGLGHAYRPCYWHRVGIPGSGGDQWFRADVEYVMCFKRPGKLPWSDNTAMGEPPKWAPGGEMSHRVKDGDRRNQWGRHMNCKTSNRKADGTFQGAARPSRRIVTRHRDGMHANDQEYSPPSLANPGCVVRTTVGGGQMGSVLAHDNEAPFPESLAEHFIRSLCPDGGTVLDPFSGSATTAATAAKCERVGIGFDLRRSQCELGRRRIPDTLAPRSKLDAAPAIVPLAGQLSLFAEDKAS
mgnify:CR=1 FL=1